MKKLFILLAFITSTAFGATSAIQTPVIGQSILNLTGINELTGYNPDFELGNTSYWTASSGDTFTTVTGGANLLFGTTSGAYTASASGKFLVSQSAPVPTGLQGGACYLGLYYKYAGATGDYSVSVDNATDTLASAVSLPTATTARYVEINYPCGSTNNRLKITSNVASPSTIYIDNAYMGSPKNVGTVAQAQLVGGAVVTGCSTYWLGTSTAGYATMGTQTGCSYATFGLAQAPATNVPGIKFASLPPGEYMIQYEGRVGATTSGKTSWFQFTDGTTNAKESSAFLNAGSSVYAATLNQSFSYSAPQTNVTWQVYAKSEAASSGGLLEGTNTTPGTFKLWYFPSSTQQAVKIDQTPASWSGYHGNASGSQLWQVTSTGTPIDFPGNASITLTQVTNRNFGTVTSQGGATTQPGLVLSFPKIGYYNICAVVNAYGNALGVVTKYQLSDGTNAFAFGSQANNYNTAVTVCGAYNATDTSSKTIRLQGSTLQAGTAYIQSYGSGIPGVMWTITALDQGMAVPVLQGSVTSNTSGQERIERATIANNGTCSVSSQSGSWISSVSHPATGQCTLNFASGAFSSAPTCIISTDVTGTAYFAALNTVPTISGVTGRTFNNAFSSVDNAFYIICQGPKN